MISLVTKLAQSLVQTSQSISEVAVKISTANRTVLPTDKIDVRPAVAKANEVYNEYRLQASLNPDSKESKLLYQRFTDLVGYPPIYVTKSEENSSVEITVNLTKLIENTNKFNAIAKTIKTADEMTKKTIDLIV